jgi:hypothetical protein
MDTANSLVTQNKQEYVNNKENEIIKLHFYLEKKT